jgi:hypothetical protein
VGVTYRWTALSSILRAPLAHRWMTDTMIIASLGLLLPLPLSVLLVSGGSVPLVRHHDARRLYTAAAGSRRAIHVGA